MAAPKGNQFWKARTKHGRDKLFASADVLWSACCEYFEWVEKHPLWESKPFHHQGEIVIAKVAKMRAMTLDGLCTFLDIHRGTWNDWRSVEDFSEVVARVESIIRDQKFSGAAADLLNVPETTPGETPATPVWDTLRLTGNTMSPSVGTQQSARSVLTACQAATL